MEEGEPGENDLKVQLKKLVPGCLLAARDLEDPNFAKTFVLLCQKGPEGAYGLVLNRPSHMPLSEIFDKSALEFFGNDGRRRVYAGGPVAADELQILQIGGDPVLESNELYPGIYLGGNWPDLSAVLGHDPREVRLFLGYSGWGKGQLEQEITCGAWDVLQVDLARMFKAPDERWIHGDAHACLWLSGSEESKDIKSDLG